MYRKENVTLERYSMQPPCQANNFRPLQGCSCTYNVMRQTYFLRLLRDICIRRVMWILRIKTMLSIRPCRAQHNNTKKHIANAQHCCTLSLYFFSSLTTSSFLCCSLARPTLLCSSAFSTDSTGFSKPSASFFLLSAAPKTCGIGT